MPMCDCMPPPPPLPPLPLLRSAESEALLRINRAAEAARDSAGEEVEGEDEGEDEIDGISMRACI